MRGLMREFAPCLPTRVPKPPTGDRWVHEIKHDGFRLIVRKTEGRVHLYAGAGLGVSLSVDSECGAFPSREFNHSGR